MSAHTRPEPYPGNPETWHGEWLQHPMAWIEDCFRLAHAIITNAPEARNYSWMSIPVERYDPDIVLSDAIQELKDYRALVTELIANSSTIDWKPDDDRPAITTAYAVDVSTFRKLKRLAGFVEQ